MIRSRHRVKALAKLTRFNNVRLVLNVLAQAWITPPQFESPAVLKSKAHIERYLKSFPTIRIIRSIFPPIYRFWVNIAIKRGKEPEVGRGGKTENTERGERKQERERQREKFSRLWELAARASPVAIHIRYQVLTTISAGKKRANMNYGSAIMPRQYTVLSLFLYGFPFSRRGRNITIFIIIFCLVLKCENAFPLLSPFLLLFFFSR